MPVYTVWLHQHKCNDDCVSVLSVLPCLNGFTWPYYDDPDQTGSMNWQYELTVVLIVRLLGFGAVLPNSWKAIVLLASNSQILYHFLVEMDSLDRLILVEFPFRSFYKNVITLVVYLPIIPLYGRDGKPTGWYWLNFLFWLFLRIRITWVAYSLFNALAWNATYYWHLGSGSFCI